MESGLNATAANYVRFGLLFLHGSGWKGRRVIEDGRPLGERSILDAPVV